MPPSYKAKLPWERLLRSLFPRGLGGPRKPAAKRKGEHGARAPRQGRHTPQPLSGPLGPSPQPWCPGEMPWIPNTRASPEGVAASGEPQTRGSLRTFPHSKFPQWGLSTRAPRGCSLCGEQTLIQGSRPTGHLGVPSPGHHPKNPGFRETWPISTRYKTFLYR